MPAIRSSSQSISTCIARSRAAAALWYCFLMTASITPLGCSAPEKSSGVPLPARGRVTACAG
jgi:hypothetical protein